MPDQHEILDLGRRWADAERAGDRAALEGLSADGLRLVGPVGFVLDRQQWLDRFTGEAALKLDRLDWSDVEITQFGAGVAVAIGIQTQAGSFAGRPAEGQFRVTQVLVRSGDEWRLAGLHYSPIGGPPPFRPTGR